MPYREIGKNIDINNNLKEEGKSRIRKVVMFYLKS